MKNQKSSKYFNIAVLVLLFLNIIVVPYCTRQFEIVNHTFSLMLFGLGLVVIRKLFTFIFGETA